MKFIEILSIIVAIVIVVVALALAVKTDILKVGAGSAGKQYSFSKFQLFLWTLVICPLFVIHWGFLYGVTETPTDIPFAYINETSLTLLSISVGTTIASAGIDVSQLSAKRKGITSLSAVRLKAEGQPSGGFWSDILAGDDGQPSIGRLQNLLFTFVYVVIFIYLFFITDGNDPANVKVKFDYPVFDRYAYSLMGISSGGYLIVKGTGR